MRLIQLPNADPATFGRCRTCRADVYWLTNDHTGKRAPIDVAPTFPGKPGNVVITGGRTYHTLTDEDRAGGDIDPRALFTNHFQTCPDREKHGGRSSR